MAIEGSSVTLKIHHLVFHVIEMLLDRFGTIGLFVEDAVESILAFVNLYLNVPPCAPIKPNTSKVGDMFSERAIGVHCKITYIFCKSTF